MASIPLLSRDHASHAPSRALYIAVAAWDEMNVRMEDGLTCIVPDVDAYVETRHLLVDDPYVRFHAVQERMHRI